MFLVAAQLCTCAMRTSLSSSSLNWPSVRTDLKAWHTTAFIQHCLFDRNCGLMESASCSGLEFYTTTDRNLSGTAFYRTCMPGGFCISMLTHSAVAFSIQAALCSCSYRPAQPSVHRLISPHGTKSREAACQEVRVQGGRSKIGPKEGFQEGHRELQDIYLQGKTLSRS